MSCLPCVEIEPAKPADAAVIWLHGLGADGHDFEPVVPELGLPDNFAVRFIFPHAPAIPVTINNGYVMPAWYDITDISFDRKVDEQQLCTSAEAVHRLIDREIERGIDARRIIIAGFSQGGAVGLQAALTYPRRLAGLLALSTYFATADSIELNPANRELPIEVYHGLFDPVIDEQHGRHCVAYLREMGFSPNYTTYPMEHSVCLEEIRDISAWLQKILG